EERPDPGGRRRDAARGARVRRPGQQLRLVGAGRAQPRRRRRRLLRQGDPQCRGGQSPGRLRGGGRRGAGSRTRGRRCRRVARGAARRRCGDLRRTSAYRCRAPRDRGLVL
ncbi:MAG: hypothetical protein AVDCRST_MAG34-371, partial [uncultured Nocardioidaceae bacterium]